ncbi:MAG: PepSY domain-containing protein [Opitutaceae bacterium]|nr:PepSY domain-containing protein [Opitutaceae bacterium]
MLNPKTVFRWHLWLGLATGLMLFIIGGSGAVAVFIEEIDWLVTPALRASATPGGPRAEPDAIVAAVQAAYPADRLSTLNLSIRPSFAHVAKVQSKTRGSLDVFIDPATGRINGDRAYTGAYTSTLRNFIRQLHLRLFMGLWGRVLVGVFGVTLLLSCLTGLWIYRGWIRNLFRLRWRSAGPRARWSGLHKFVGLWSLAFNLVFGLTGAVFGLENLVSQVESRWLPKPPATAKPPRPAPATAAPAPATPSLPLSVLLEHAHAAFPDFVPRVINFPSRAAGPIVLRGDVPSLLVQQSHVRRVNSITLDPFSGAVLQQTDGRKATGWSRIYSSFDPLHFGYFGGIPTKIIWFIAGLAPSVLSFTGAWLWWRRTRAPRTAAAPPPAPRPAHLLPLTLAATTLALAGAYLLVARAQGSWAFTGKTIEHGLAKPVALLLVAFPVTGLLGWLAARFSARRLPYAGIMTLACAYYLTLVSFFQ